MSVSRRAFVAALVALVAAPERAPTRRRARRSTIIVADYTSAAWDGVLVRTVADFNAVMPKGGPRLIYQRRASGVCPERVDTCSGDTGEWAGWATIGTPGESFVMLSDSPLLNDFGKRAVACHEFMHALTSIKDCYGCRVDSCVHGWRETPGAFDVKRLRKVWGNDKRRSRKKRR
jgi:hypothetical protein